MINEGLFKSKYEKYKARVIKLVSKVEPGALRNQHSIDSCCRDFFVDQVSERDCAHCIIDFFRATQKQKLSEAKRLLREHGYRIKNI